MAVDKQKHTVSIAPGTAASAERDKAVVFFLTPDTKFSKDGSRATLDDAVIGQKVLYSIRPGREDGSYELSVLQFVPDAKQESNK